MYIIPFKLSENTCCCCCPPAHYKIATQLCFVCSVQTLLPKLKCSSSAQSSVAIRLSCYDYIRAGSLYRECLQLSRNSEHCALQALTQLFRRGGGGGVHFKLERTSCQQSLKYIFLFNKEGAPFSTEKKRNMFLCN